MAFSKNKFLKNLCCGTQCGGFQLLQILDLWGKSFHAEVVFSLGKNLLFKAILGRCEILSPRISKLFEISRTMYSNSAKSEFFLKQNAY